MSSNTPIEMTPPAARRLGPATLWAIMERRPDRWGRVLVSNTVDNTLFIPWYTGGVQCVGLIREKTTGKQYTYRIEIFDTDEHVWIYNSKIRLLTSNSPVRKQLEMMHGNRITEAIGFKNNSKRRLKNYNHNTK